MSPFIRIGLRYLAAVLVTRGLVSPDAGAILGHDPDIAAGAEILAGVMLGAATEGAYLVARRYGWRT